MARRPVPSARPEAPIAPPVPVRRGASFAAWGIAGLLAGFLLAAPASARKECVPVEPDVSAPRPGGASAGATGATSSEEGGPKLRCRVSRRRNECRVLARQIAHFEGVLELARDRDDALWEKGTERHIARLEARRDRLCPKPEGGAARFARSLGRFLQAAGSAAASAAAAALLP